MEYTTGSVGTLSVNATFQSTNYISSLMTDEEKKSVSGWEQMGGYLKTLSYKEAWAAGWAKASDEQKKWYESLPNFDADIFFEITGIKIGEKSLSGKKVKVELDGKTYAATID